MTTARSEAASVIHQKCLSSYTGFQYAVRYQVTPWMQSTKHWYRKELSKKVQEVTESTTRFISEFTQTRLRHEVNLTFEPAIKTCQIEKYLQKRPERKAGYRVKAWNQNHEQRRGNSHWLHNRRGSLRPEQNYATEVCSSGPQDFTVISPRHCRRCKDMVSTRVMTVHKETKRINADRHIP